MKLLNKILTATLPVSLVGILTPTIASCSCNKKGLTLNYTDTINCMFKDKEHYHKHGDIANAIKPHVLKEGQKEIEQAILNQINDEWARSSERKQIFFWDFAAAYVIIRNEDLYLDGWVENGATVSFKLNNDDVLSNKTLKYSKVDGKIVISFDGIAQPVQSYIFSDCW